MVIIDSSDVNEKLSKLAELIKGYCVVGDIIKENDFVSFNVVFEPRPQNEFEERINQLEERFSKTDCTFNYISKSDSFYGIKCLVSRNISEQKKIINY
ncbi:hypothetical protein GQ473_01545 [archaeon]|nr:hypothetical protein [archaeon]